MLQTVINRIERSGLLDRLSDAVRPTVQALVGSGPAQDALTGRWLGHPVHPAAVMAPLSCWFASTTLDVVGGRDSRAASQRLLGLGVIAALPAAASGSADWLDLQGPEQRNGSAHALANGAAWSLFTTSWLLRRRGAHTPAVAVSLLATGAAAGAAFLGGHLAYVQGVGVNTTAFPTGPDDWEPVPEGPPAVVYQPAAVAVGDVTLVMVDDGHRTRALDDRCTHRGGPLHEGTVEKDCITCPWHGSRFDLETGAVRQGPASIPQPAYDTRFDDGSFQVRRR